jgi:hypothetical protein
MGKKIGADHTPAKVECGRPQSFQDTPRAEGGHEYV